jgi:hypothetical protein
MPRVSADAPAAISLEGDSPLWALICGFFAAAGIFACVRVDHVRETVVRDLEDIRADIFTDTAPGAEVGIDFGHTHDFLL